MLKEEFQRFLGRFSPPLSPMQVEEIARGLDLLACEKLVQDIAAKAAKKTIK